MPGGSPTFDLVVGTLGRVDELGRLLDSLEAQTYRSFRVLVVDQNEDDRAEAVLSRRDLDLVRLSSAPGLARARNVALDRVEADVVGFPDDDCRYPPALLADVADPSGPLAPLPPR